MLNHSRLSRIIGVCATLLVTLALAGQTLADFGYPVQPGDSLSKIAVKNNITLAAIVAANKAQFPCLATNPVCLQAGWVLTIPGTGVSGNVSSNPGTYTVQAGDSLTKIARKFGISYSALLNANTAARPCLANQPGCALQIGWTLVIPGGLVTATVQTTPEVVVREYFAALNARDFARFKAILHPNLIAQSPDPDFDIHSFIDILQDAQIKFEILSLNTSALTATSAEVNFTERVNSPLAAVNGYQASATFSLTKTNGRWLISDESIERIELIP